MMIEMYESKEKLLPLSKSRCFLEAYRGAENVIAITITGGLSEAQKNSAQLAKKNIRRKPLKQILKSSIAFQQVTK